MNSAVTTLNLWGDSFLNLAGTMFWQSSLLALVILAVDFSLHRRVRASVRHGLWLVLLVKLVLPPSLALPTSPAWWWSRREPAVVRTPTPVLRIQTTAQGFVPTQAEVASLEAVPATMPTEVPAPPPGPALTLSAWILLAASVGSLGLLVWLGWRYGLVLRCGQRAKEAEEIEPLLAQARRLANLERGSVTRTTLPAERWLETTSGSTCDQSAAAHRAALLAQVRVKISRDTMSPAVCGLFRPVILLPQSLVETLSPEQLRAVLLHELTHVRRGDLWVNFAQGLLQIVYWWHPLVWLANVRIRRVREEAVDDAVMVALRADAEIYAPTLLAVARFALQRPLASLGLMGILESRSALRQRIERLVNLPVPRKAGLSLVSVFGLLMFSAVALPMGDAPPSVPVGTAHGGLSTGNAQTVSELSVTNHDSSVQFEKNSRTNQPVSDKPFLDLALPVSYGEIPRDTAGPATNLDMRTFKLDASALLRFLRAAATNAEQKADFEEFEQKLKNPISGVTSNAGKPSIFAKEFFRATGVLIVPPKSMFYSVTRGELLVRANSTDLNKIERSLEALMRIAAHTTDQAGATNIMASKFMLQDGRLLYNMGKLNDAEGKLEAAIKLDPDNVGAYFYLNLIQQARLNEDKGVANASPMATSQPGAGELQSSNPVPVVPNVPSAANTNTPRMVFTGPGRHEVVRKLSTIQLSVAYDHLPLSEVVRQLSAQVKDLDPQKTGVNFLINPNNVVAGTPNSATAPGGVDLGEAQVTLSLRNVRAQDLVEAITLVADQPLAYSIQDFGVMFYPKPPDALAGRTFKVDPGTFSQGLEGVGSKSFGATANAGGAGSGGANSSGGNGNGGGTVVPTVDMAPGLNSTHSPSSPEYEPLFTNDVRIYIQAYVFELSGELTNLACLPKSVDGKTATGILKPDAIRAFWRAFAASTNGTILGEPESHTISGRSAHMRVQGTTPVLMELKGSSLQVPADPAGHSQFLDFTNVETDKVLDAVPRLLEGGHSIELDVAVSLKEFDGYEGMLEGGMLMVETAYVVPKPLITQRELGAHLKLQAGETMAIYDGTPRYEVRFKSDAGGSPSEVADCVPDHLLVLLTVSTVDPKAGRPPEGDFPPDFNFPHTRKTRPGGGF